jgi:hypothetical protein
MRRFLATSVLAAMSAGLLLASACGDSALSSPGETPDAAIHREGGLVEPPGADAGVDGAAPPPGTVPSCEAYCTTVMDNCKGAEQQYLSQTECKAFCDALPAGQPDDKSGPTLACRAYFAGSPAKTDPMTYCPKAGPFGGGECGDRCTAFCTVALEYCSADAGTTAPAPYTTNPECQSACVAWTYKDAGADAYWNEALYGPEQGNSLNCRLYHLRSVVRGGLGCGDLGPDGGACK